MAEAPSPKQDLDLIQNLFLQPFARRQKYLYTGTSAPGCYLLGTHLEDKFRYAEPKQALALAVLREPETAARVAAWFAQLGLCLETPGVVHLAGLCTALAKVKGDFAQIDLQPQPSGHIVIANLPPEAEDSDSETLAIQEEDEADEERLKFSSFVLFEPAFSFFTFEKLAHLAQQYTGLLDGRVALALRWAVPVEHVEKLALVRLRPDEVRARLPTAEAGVRVILQRGLDYLQTKRLLERAAKRKDESPQQELCFWSDGGHRLSYAHCYGDASVALLATRCNASVVTRR